MKWFFQREERAQRTLMLPPSGKKKHYKSYRTTVLRPKYRVLNFNYDQQRTN